MSNTSNYIQVTETTQSFSQSSIKNKLEWEPIRRHMSFFDYVTIFSRDERVKHCNFIEINTNTGHIHAENKVGKILCQSRQPVHAVANLKKFILDTYNIELIGPQTQSVQLCHLCKHNSVINKKNSTLYTCTNPLHSYFGTVSENNLDKDDEIKRIGGIIGGAKGIESQIATGTHSTQIRNKCPYCQFETTKYTLIGSHIPACHFNPTSHNYLKPILKNPKLIKKYQIQGLQYKIDELNQILKIID